MATEARATTLAEATPGRAGYLAVRALTKRFGDLLACDEIDLEVPEGQFFTIVGPSGSGKSTLLKMLAGMLAPTSGRILVDGKDVTDLPPQRRPTCLVFQGLALFPHRTVGENIEFSLKIRRLKRQARRARALELMTLLRLPEAYYGKSVLELSGGERQRVAIARALAYGPEILLFDEPLSAIDYQLRKALQRELKDIHHETGRTFVYVTHSLEEALVMSDRLGIMREGRMVQMGTPDEIYHRPANKAVSEFMGEVNVFPVRRTGAGDYRCDAVGRTFRVEPDRGLDAGFLVVRPERVRFLADGAGPPNVVEGVVTNHYAMGSRMQYRVEAGDVQMIVERLADEPTVPLGSRRSLGWDADSGWIVPH